MTNNFTTTFALQNDAINDLKGVLQVHNKQNQDIRKENVELLSAIQQIEKQVQVSCRLTYTRQLSLSLLFVSRGNSRLVLLCISRLRTLRGLNIIHVNQREIE